MQTFPVHTLVTHIRPHRDEYVAFIILKYYGDSRFPGVREAIKNQRFEFWDAGVETPDGRTAKEWLESGFLCIGVGGGLFDEHALPETHAECAATLVAKYLGVHKRPELEQLLRITLQIDQRGTTDPMGFDALLRIYHERYFKEQATVVSEWALNSIEHFYANQLNFFQETAKEFERHAHVIDGEYDGKIITVVVIQSDDEKIAAFARSSYGANAQVVICQNKRKHVYLSTHGDIRLDHVIRKLRIAELKTKDRSCNFGDPRLSDEAAYPGAEEWHYHKKARMIMNGSMSAPNKPATKIPFDDVVDIVLKALKQTVISTPNKKSVRA